GELDAEEFSRNAATPQRRYGVSFVAALRRCVSSSDGRFRRRGAGGATRKHARAVEDLPGIRVLLSGNERRSAFLLLHLEQLLARQRRAVVLEGVLAGAAPRTGLALTDGLGAGRL